MIRRNLIEKVRLRPEKNSDYCFSPTGQNQVPPASPETDFLENEQVHAVCNEDCSPLDFSMSSSRSHF